MSATDAKQGPTRPRRGRPTRAPKRSRASQSAELDGEELNTKKALEDTPETDGTSSIKRANIQFECSVCLDSCVHPTELPCSHIFCFLCVKGASIQSRQCPLCRATIPWGFFSKPKLVHCHSEENQEKGDGHSWFYEGKQGWWQYDSKTGEQLEARYENGEKRFSIMIAGASYIVDLDRMLQYPTTRVGRTRQIKRDAATAEKLGVAGIPKL